VTWPALACLVVVCTARAAGPPASDLDAIRSNAANGAFTFANAPRRFEFPQDHGPHPNFRHEWWDVTGHLDSTAGERFGFEVTFVRIAVAPDRQGANEAAPDLSDAASAGVSRWPTRQIYFAHFAVTDVARGEFRFAEKFSRDALGLAGAQAQPFRVWLDDW